MKNTCIVLFGRKCRIAQWILILNIQIKTNNDAWTVLIGRKCRKTKLVLIIKFLGLREPTIHALYFGSRKCE